MERRLWILRAIIIFLFIFITFFYLYLQPISISEQFEAIRYSTVDKAFSDLDIEDIKEYTSIKVSVSGNFYTLIDDFKFYKKFQGIISILDGKSNSHIYVNAHLYDNVYEGKIFVQDSGATDSGFIFIYANKNRIEKIYLFYHTSPTTYKFISIPSRNINQALEIRNFFNTQ